MADRVEVLGGWLGAGEGNGVSGLTLVPPKHAHARKGKLVHGAPCDCELGVQCSLIQPAKPISVGSDW